MSVLIRTAEPPPGARISENSLRILQKRYLHNGESVDSLWDRVSGGNPQYRELLSSLRFLPNSPTLFNAGLNNGCTLSACFVFNIEDCMTRHNGKINWNSIMGTRWKAVEVAKAGGGTGFYFGDLREKGAHVSTVHRRACGPVAVLRDYQAISPLITQGGKRELAQMGVLPVTHPDIEEWIHVKDQDPQGLGSFNISVNWDEESLRQVQWKLLEQWEEGGGLSTDNGSSVNFEPNRLTRLWWEQVDSAWRHGCPGMFFVDRVNQGAGNPNPHLGRIKAPNACGETPNRNDEPCNLGSLAVSRYFLSYNRSVDWSALERDARLATRFMDDILTWNVFPHENIARAALLTRKLGLGVMGWSKLLGLLHIHYDTEEAVELGRQMMKLINDAATDESEKLARERGPYEGYCATRTQAPMRRNETNTSVAPTGTIAPIADLGLWQGIEPPPYLCYERTTAEGIKLREEVDLEELEGFVPKTAHEIDPYWHVLMQSAFQAHTGLGVSKTINLPKSATRQQVSNAYQHMWQSGCKGGTIYRDGCRDEQVIVAAQSKKTKSVFQTGLSTDQIEDITRRACAAPDRDTALAILAEGLPAHLKPAASAVAAVIHGNGNGHADNTPRHLPQDSQLPPSPAPFLTTNPVSPVDDPEATGPIPSASPSPAEIQAAAEQACNHNRRRLPDEVATIRRKFRVGGIKGYLHVGMYPDGSPGEIFLTAGMGSTVDGFCDTWAKTFSNALQHGTALERLVRQSKGIQFEPCGLTGVKEVPTCTSIPDFVVRWLEWRFLVKPGKAKAEEQRHTGMYCEDCGQECYRSEGCLKCPDPTCGWSRCS